MTVTLGGNDSPTASCTNGTVQFTVTKTTDGSYNFTLSQTDRAGNATITAATIAWTRDTTVTLPPTPTITTPAANPYYSNTALASIGGACESASVHTINLSGAQTGSTACSGSAYSIPLSAPSADGTYTLFVSQVENATGLNSSSTTLTWIFDTVAPAVLTLSTPTSSPMVTTGDITMLISGSCVTDATVNLVGDTVDEAFSGTSTSTTCVLGLFTFTVTQPGGSTEVFNYTLTQTDKAGNLSDALTHQWIRDPARAASQSPAPFGPSAHEPIDPGFGRSIGGALPCWALQSPLPWRPPGRPAPDPWRLFVPSCRPASLQEGLIRSHFQTHLTLES